MPPRFTIDTLRRWCDVRFDRSAGPGGQNVNKVNTRATLIFDFRACDELSAEEKERIARRLASRLDRDGRLRIVAQSGRTQTANRSAAEARLLALLAAALHVAKARRATRPTRASQRRRLAAKRQRSHIKRLRGVEPGE